MDYTGDTPEDACVFEVSTAGELDYTMVAHLDPIRVGWVGVDDDTSDIQGSITAELITAELTAREVNQLMHLPMNQVIGPILKSAGACECDVEEDS